MQAAPSRAAAAAGSPPRHTQQPSHPSSSAAASAAAHVQPQPSAQAPAVHRVIVPHTLSLSLDRATPDVLDSNSNSSSGGESAPLSARIPSTLGQRSSASTASATARMQIAQPELSSPPKLTVPPSRNRAFSWHASSTSDAEASSIHGHHAAVAVPSAMAPSGAAGPARLRGGGRPNSRQQLRYSSSDGSSASSPSNSSDSPMSAAEAESPATQLAQLNRMQQQKQRPSGQRSQPLESSMIAVVSPSHLPGTGVLTASPPAPHSHSSPHSSSSNPKHFKRASNQSHPFHHHHSSLSGLSGISHSHSSSRGLGQTSDDGHSQSQPAATFAPHQLPRQHHSAFQHKRAHPYYRQGQQSHSHHNSAHASATASSASASQSSDAGSSSSSSGSHAVPRTEFATNLSPPVLTAASAAIGAGDESMGVAALPPPPQRTQPSQLGAYGSSGMLLSPRAGDFAASAPLRVPPLTSQASTGSTTSSVGSSSTPSSAGGGASSGSSSGSPAASTLPVAPSRFMHKHHPHPIRVAHGSSSSVQQHLHPHTSMVPQPRQPHLVSSTSLGDRSGFSSSGSTGGAVSAGSSGGGHGSSSGAGSSDGSMAHRHLSSSGCSSSPGEHDSGSNLSARSGGSCSGSASASSCSPDHAHSHDDGGLQSGGSSCSGDSPSHGGGGGDGCGSAVDSPVEAWQRGMSPLPSSLSTSDDDLAQEMALEHDQAMLEHSMLMLEKMPPLRTADAGFARILPSVSPPPSPSPPSSHKHKHKHRHTHQHQHQHSQQHQHHHAHTHPQPQHFNSGGYPHHQHHHHHEHSHAQQQQQTSDAQQPQQSQSQFPSSQQPQSSQAMQS